MSDIAICNVNKTWPQNIGYVTATFVSVSIFAFINITIHSDHSLSLHETMNKEIGFKYNEDVE